MLGYISIAIASLTLLWLSRALLSLHAKVQQAKASGLPYAIAPINGIAGFLWTAIHDFILPILKWLPFSRGWLWPTLVEPHRSWHFAQELRETLGEVFLIVSPGQIYMSCSNAEAIVQISNRRNDFQKPVEIYGIVDIFGTSVLSTEGADWKRHRKIVAPAFSEKGNALVWKESLRQAEGILKFWSRFEGNDSGEIKVKDTARDTALMTLHVISGAGFGVRQVWDGEGEEQLGSKVVPGFNSTKLRPNHTLPFKNAIDTLLHGMIWFAIFPIWLLNQFPFDVTKKLMKSYFECADYFRELSEYKIEQIESGEMTDKGTMDLMGPLVQASQNSPEDSKGLYLTKQEVTGNAFILLFAGHESTANTIHFCLVYLAIALDSQAALQVDIDSIVGSRSPGEWTYESDMGRLQQSMVGAVMNEALRLMPPIIDIPKIVREKPQQLTFDGKTVTVPPTTSIHLSAVGVQRNPRYWPHSPSKISTKAHDLDDFIPERWLPSSPYSTAAIHPAPTSITTTNKPPPPTDREATPPSSTTSTPLLTPPKGAYIPFSLAFRSCPGTRFATVEIVAVLALIFSRYTIELDVSAWASDAELKAMTREQRQRVYEKAQARARRCMRESETVITLQMREAVGVRFVRRGGGIEARFAGREGT